MAARQRTQGRKELLAENKARWVLLLIGVSVTTVSFAAAYCLSSQPHVPRSLSDQSVLSSSPDPAGGHVRRTSASSNEPGGVAVARLQIQSPSELQLGDGSASVSGITVLPDHGNEQEWINPHVGQADAQPTPLPATTTEPPVETPPIRSYASEQLWINPHVGQADAQPTPLLATITEPPLEIPPIPSYASEQLWINPHVGLADAQPTALPATTIEPPREIPPIPSYASEQLFINPHVGQSEALPTALPATTIEPPVEIPPIPSYASEMEIGPPPAIKPETINQPSLPTPEPAFDLRTEETTQVAKAPETEMGENGESGGRNVAANEVATTEGDRQLGPATQAVETWTDPSQPAVTVQVTAMELPPESVQHVTGMIRQAVGQAERGALYLSRQQLLESLRTMSWMLDRETGGRLHATALADALRALDEADDFSLASVDYLTESAVDSFIAGHATAVLKAAASPNPLEAREAYYTFARDALVTACGSEPIGAQALYSLARIEAELRARSASHHRSGPRELPLYEAALAVHPQHAVAANELGVALARDGQLTRSVQWFQRSANTAPNPKVLANLSKVYSQLGNHRAASSVEQALANQRRRAAAPGHAAVPLVTFQQFNAQLRPNEANPLPPAANNARLIDRGSQPSHAPVGYFPQVPKPRKMNAVEVMSRRLFSGNTAHAR